MTSSRIWPATNGPSNEDNADPVTLGTRFTLSATGWVTHLHYWRGTVNDTGSHNAAIFKVSDSSLVTGTSITLPAVGTGWQTGQLATPVQLTAGVTYVVAVLHPDGHPAFTGGYWASGGPGFGGITNGILTAPDSPTAGGQGVFSGGSTLQCPTNTFGGNNYWNDLTVSDTDPGSKNGTGATSATAALAETGSKNGRGTGATPATSALSETGTKGATGSSSVTAASELASTGRKNGAGAAALTATAGTSSIGRRSTTGTAALAGTAGLTASGRTSRRGTGTLTATAALIGSGHKDVVVIPRFKVGPPRTRWRVGPPRTS